MELYQIILLFCMVFIMVIDMFRIYRLKRKIRDMMCENNNLLYTCKRNQNLLLNRYKIIQLWLKMKIINKCDWDSVIRGDKVILYGITDLGYLLYLDLHDKKTILAIVDKRGLGRTLFGDSTQIISVKELEYFSDKQIPVIVTPIAYYEEIAKDLAKMGFCNIISLENCF